jgi:tetratricopeptide (TPR) repeat protein
LLEILRSYFGIQEGDPEDVIEGKLRAGIAGSDEKLLWAFPAYQDLLSLPVHDDAWLKLEPKEKRVRTFEALRDLIIGISEEKPVLLVLDDLHWMDKTSEEFLEYFIGWVANTHILTLLLYRPEYTHPWGSKSYYGKIGLDQLSIQTSAELVASILKDGEIVPELRELILSRSAGNPLFMEELTQTLRENGSIQRQNHRYVLSAKAADIQVPDTVQGIIAARMDRLEDDIKRTMQVASVIGKDFAFRILEGITGMRDTLKTYLLRLQDLEFIYEKSLFPELEYIFKHAVTQEVAYNSLLLQRKKELHEKIGNTIEQLYKEKPEEFFEILAYHFSRSNAHFKAYQYLRFSADKVIRNNSAWEAFGYYKEAISALNRLPETEEIKRKQVEALHLMLVPVIVLGFPEDSLPMLEEGVRVAQELGDKSGLIRFYSNMGLYYSSRGKHTEGLTYSEKALEEAAKIPDIESMARSGPDVCLSSMAAGNYVKAFEVASRVTHLIEKTNQQAETFGGPTNVYPALLSTCGHCAAMLGDFGKALALCAKSLQLAHDIGNPTTIGLCEYNYGFVAILQGDGKLAEWHFKNSIKFLEKVQFIQPLALAWSGLGIAELLKGELEVGRKHVEKGYKIHRDAEIEWNLSTQTIFLSACHYESGDLDEALHFIEEAGRLAQKNHEKHIKGKSLIWLGRILGKGRFHQSAESEAHILRGLKILEALKTKPDVAAGYFFLGEVYANRGQEKEALENLRRAKEMFQEMGMDYWLVRVQEALGRL